MSAKETLATRHAENLVAEAASVSRQLEFLERCIVELRCSICHGVFDEPTSLDCGHVFCRSCIERWKNSRCTFVLYFDCPICRTKADVGTVRRHNTCLSNLVTLMSDMTKSVSQEHQRLVEATVKQLPTCERLCNVAMVHPHPLVAQPSIHPRPANAQPVTYPRPVAVRHVVYLRSMVSPRPVAAQPVIRPRPMVTQPVIRPRPVVAQPVVRQHPMAAQPVVRQHPAANRHSLLAFGSSTPRFF